jgi:hypothetical protein
VVAGVCALARLQVRLPLLLFFAYSIHIFGKPTIPYSYEVSEYFREGMSNGVMGVTAPKAGADVVPVVAPVPRHPVLVAVAADDDGHRGLGDPPPSRAAPDRSSPALVTFIGYFLFNAGYYQWWGGSAMGPRLMIPMFAVVPAGMAALVACVSRRCPVVDVAPAGGRHVLAIAVVLTLPISMIDAPRRPVGNSTDVLDERGASAPAVRTIQLEQWRDFFMFRWTDIKPQDRHPQLDASVSFAARVCHRPVAPSFIIGGTIAASRRVRTNVREPERSDRVARDTGDARPADAGLRRTSTGCGNVALRGIRRCGHRLCRAVRPLVREEARVVAARRVGSSRCRARPTHRHRRCRRGRWQAADAGTLFRPDIEGLRSIAVLLVLVYHAKFDIFSGGFIGVDVFFVLSGFLITSLLLRELAATGTISLSNFWARRARRLLPASGLVLLVTLVSSRWLIDGLSQGEPGSRRDRRLPVRRQHPLLEGRHRLPLGRPARVAAAALLVAGRGGAVLPRLAGDCCWCW